MGYVLANDELITEHDDGPGKVKPSPRWCELEMTELLLFFLFNQPYTYLNALNTFF